MPRGPWCVYNTGVKDRINSYFATLLIVAAGAAAVWMINRMLSSATLTSSFGGSEANYAPLQQSILKQ